MSIDQPRIGVMFMQSQTYFGADSYIHSLLMKHLDREVVSVHVACNYGDGPEKSASAQALERIADLHIRPTKFGVSVNARGKRQIVRDAWVSSVPSLQSLGGLVQYIRANNIRVIHCTEKPRDAFYGQLLAKATGARCAIHLHVKAEDWLSRSVQWSMGQADAIIGVSDFVADSAVAMGYAREKTYSLLNAIELERWNPTLDGSRVRAELGIAPSTPVLLAVSRLCYWKGHTELLQALALVKRHTQDFKLLIVGEDDPRAHPGGGSYTAELRQLTTELGLEDQVTFTGFRRDIPELMAACDLYTMPSFEEPFGMVYLEAMAMEKAVIALDNGGAREVVVHGQTGLLSSPQDIAGLANNILLMLNDPDMRREMGKRGRTRVRTCFTPATMARHAEEIYQHVLAS